MSLTESVDVKYGPSGIGKTQLLRAALHDFAQKGELHIVSFPSNELKKLHKLLEDLAQHWQLRFVILIDGLILKDGDGHVKLLKSALDGICQDFPSNIIICGTSTHCLQAEDAHISLSNLRSSFGMIIQMKNLILEEYLVCAGELLNLKMMLFPSIKVNMADLVNRANNGLKAKISTLSKMLPSL